MACISETRRLKLSVEKVLSQAAASLSLLFYIIQTVAFLCFAYALLGCVQCSWLFLTLILVDICPMKGELWPVCWF